ncbi:MAG: class I tRNA ligase family protein, partial [Patescibacteria group bacterium]
MHEKFLKPYNPAETEDRIYKLWLERGDFSPQPNSGKEPFSMVLPPPNVTGVLHMGHATMVT